jgi:hypothetical protein
LLYCWSGGKAGLALAPNEKKKKSRSEKTGEQAEEGKERRQDRRAFCLYTPKRKGTGGGLPLGGDALPPEMSVSNKSLVLLCGGLSPRSYPLAGTEEGTRDYVAQLVALLVALLVVVSVAKGSVVADFWAAYS